MVALHRTEERLPALMEKGGLGTKWRPGYNEAFVHVNFLFFSIPHHLCIARMVHREPFVFWHRWWNLYHYWFIERVAEGSLFLFIIFCSVDLRDYSWRRHNAMAKKKKKNYHSKKRDKIGNMREERLEENKWHVTGRCHFARYKEKRLSVLESTNLADLTWVKPMAKL